MPLDDPDELFDVCDPDGRPLGFTKRRGLVHRDGDWHRSVHIWVLMTGDGPRVLLQRRSVTKDTHPGKVDVAVAGHLRAGETSDAARREAEEEIGLAVGAHELMRLGLRRRVDARERHVDRELQEVFLATTDRSLESLCPDPTEVSALMTVPLGALQAMVRGERESVHVQELCAGEVVVQDAVLYRTDLLPDADAYFSLALGSIARLGKSEGSEVGWLLDEPG